MDISEFKSLVYVKICKNTDGVVGREIYNKIDSQMWDGIRIRHNELCHNNTSFSTEVFASTVALEFIKMFNQPSKEQIELTEDVKQRLLRIKDDYLDMAIANPQVSEDMKFLADKYLNNKADIFFDLLPKPTLPEPPKPVKEEKRVDFFKVSSITMMLFLCVVALITIL